MSCWVVPTLAAELWQIPLDHLLDRIRRGEIPVKDEDGFTFVDVAPYGPRIEHPIRPHGERPQTFTAIEHEPVSDPELAIVSDEAEIVEEEILSPIDETETADLGDWRSARRKASRLRVPPRRTINA